MEHVLGIALGSTNACAAVMGDHGVQVVPNADGNRTTPAMVAFLESGENLIGELAKRQVTINPASTITGLPRLIGRRFADDEMRRFARSCAFGVVASSEGDAWLSVRDKRSPPEQVAALLLDRLRRVAADHVGAPVRDVVLSVPVWFDHGQRGALHRAARFAGLEVVSLIDEPLAAALAHDEARRIEGGRSRIVAVYDLGGSSFSFTVLERRGDQLGVRASSSDAFLGGRDFDTRIVDYLAEHFQEQTGLDLRADPLAHQRLREAAESTKHELSAALTSSVNLPFIAAVDGTPRHLADQVSRATLETLSGDLIERTLAPCRTALTRAGLGIGDIDELILVGGQTRMPRVREVVATFFRRAPAARVSPDEAVAMGAAIDGARLRGAVAAPQLALQEPPPAAVEPEKLAAAASAPASPVLDPAAFEPPEDELLPATASVEVPTAFVRGGASGGIPLDLDDGRARRDGWGHSAQTPVPSWTTPMGLGTSTGVWVPPPPPRVAPPKSRRGLLYLMLGAAAVVAVAWPVMAAVRSHQRTARIALLAPASASTASERMIPILVAVRPAHALVELDGVVTRASRISVPRDGRRHTLRFSAPGYVPQVIPFDADELQLVKVELARLAEGQITAAPVP